MSTVAPSQPWEPLDIPLDNPADLEVIVTAAEGMTEQAVWQVLHIRAVRVRALAEEARAAVIEMTELQERSCRPGWDGDNAMSTLVYRSERVASLARQARRNFAVYLRHRARLEAHNTTGEGRVHP